MQYWRKLQLMHIMVQVPMWGAATTDAHHGSSLDVACTLSMLETAIFICVGCSNAEEFEAERLSASMRFQKAEASAIAAQHELIDVTKRYPFGPQFPVFLARTANPAVEVLVSKLLLVAHCGTFTCLIYILLRSTRMTTMVSSIV